jgi:PleD family two-component response regulator
MFVFIWSEALKMRFGATMRDVPMCRANDERVHHLAHCDQLTLFPHRTLFFETLKRSLWENAPSAVLLVDLDEFKEVNQQRDYAAEDADLIETALRIRRCVPVGTATVGSFERRRIVDPEVGGSSPPNRTILSNKIRGLTQS